jgi:hypothetical protein
MIQKSKQEAIKKWGAILDGMGLTGSKADWMSQYAEMHSSSEAALSNDTAEDFPALLPIAMKIAAQTIGTDIVPVVPIGGGNTSEEMEEIRKEVKIENRDRKIESIVEGKDFEEMKVQDHPDYIKPQGPSGQLFYLDFKYGGTESNATM